MFFFRSGASLKVTYSPLQKRLPFCRSIYVKKVMKLLAFIFEQPSYISQFIRFARVCSNVVNFNNSNLYLTAKLLKQGYRYHKIRKAFSKFYHRPSELIVK